MEERRFDLRTLERSLLRGRISQAEYDSFLGGLEDAAENCEPIEVNLHDEESEAEEGASEEADAAPEGTPDAE